MCHRPGSSMTGALTIWSLLLRALCKYQTLFPRLFLEHLVIVLGEPPECHPPPDAFREAIYEWVLYTLSSITGTSQREGLDQAEDMRNVVMTQCMCMSPTAWTSQLTTHLVTDSASSDFQERWQPYMDEIASS